MNGVGTHLRSGSGFFDHHYGLNDDLFGAVDDLVLDLGLVGGGGHAPYSVGEVLIKIIDQWLLDDVVKWP